MIGLKNGNSTNFKTVAHLKLLRTFISHKIEGT